MSYAVKSGTTESYWIGDAATPAGHVRYDGEIIKGVQMIWDAGLNNIRVATDPEISSTLLARLYAEAKAFISANDSLNKKDKATLLETLAEFNRHGDKFNALFAAIAASTSLANLQTRVAALGNYPTRTIEQMRTAIANRIDAGEADG